MFIISVGKKRRKGEGWTKEDCRALHTVNHSQFTVLLPASERCYHLGHFSYSA